MKNIIVELNSGKSFIPYYKSLARCIGKNESIIFSELCRTSSLLEQDEFFESNEKIMDETVSTEWEVRSAIKHLAESGIITIIKKGMPAVRYFRINTERFVEIIENNIIIAYNDSKSKNSDSSVESTGHVQCEALDCNYINSIDNNIINNKKEELIKEDVQSIKDCTDIKSNSENTSELFGIFNSSYRSNKDTHLESSNNILTEIAQDLFAYWNNKKLRVHRGYQDKYIERLSKLLKNENIDTIKKSIDNYEIAQHDDKFFWNYVWDLQDFIDPKEKRYKRFLDGGDIWEKYISGSKDQQSVRKSSMFNEEYNSAIKNGESVDELDKKHAQENKEWRTRTDVIHL